MYLVDNPEVRCYIVFVNLEDIQEVDYIDFEGVQWVGGGYKGERYFEE